jgi:hypothetical protein
MLLTEKTLSEDVFTFALYPANNTFMKLMYII